jgi:putative DNA primase/helicase
MINKLLNISTKHETVGEIREEAMMLIALKQATEATEQIVKYLKNKYYFKSIRNDKDEEIWIYIDGIYIPNGKSYIQEETREILGKLYTTHLSNQIIDKIYADTFIDQDEFFNQQNKFPLLLPVENGILNIKTKELQNFTPFNYFFTKIKTKYVPGKTCSKIIQFITSIVENKEDVDTIQEMIGFCLLREYKLEKGFMLHGKDGRNGKSKLLSLIQLLIGAENCANVSLHEIEKEQFSLINLHNKLVNISADISKEAIENTGIYKQLTGRDTVNANRKGRSHIQFVNYAKMIFACNELPMINTLSNAFWLRWVVINFPFKFLPQHEIDSLEDKTNCFIQNTDIINDITSEEEIQGLLNWALEGLDRVIIKNKFANETSSSVVKKYWLRKSNSVAAFIEDCIEIDYESKLSKQEFRKAYHNYCVRNNLTQMSDKAIKITMSIELGLTDTYSKESMDSEFVNKELNRVWHWEGVRLKPSMFSYNPDRILSYLNDHEKARYKELQDYINNDEELNACLKALSLDGQIVELPKGTWRIVN